MKKSTLFALLTIAYVNLYSQTISFNPTTLNPFTAELNKHSEVQSVAVQALHFPLSGMLNINPVGDGFEISLDQENWGISLTANVNIPSQGIMGPRYRSNPLIVYVRFSPTTTGNVTGAVTGSFGGVNSFVAANGSIATDITNVNQPNLPKVSIFPNPTTGILNIDGFAKTSYDFKIMNILGGIVNQGKIDNNIVDVSGLTNGTYLLILSNESEINSVRFIKN